MQHFFKIFITEQLFNGHVKIFYFDPSLRVFLKCDSIRENHNRVHEMLFTLDNFISIQDPPVNFKLKLIKLWTFVTHNV